MRKQILTLTGACVLLFSLAGGLAWAESGGVTFTIPFDFFVKDHPLPAGTYQIRPSGSNHNQLTVQDTSTGKTVVTPVLTRLSSFGGSRPKIAFDKTEDGKHYLSEFHIPGMDGFAIQGAPSAHTHEILDAK
jgi:hypothetical protein